MAFTTIQKVRDITNIVVADLSDDEITALITCAVAQVNSDLNTDVIRERIVQIDNTRKNEINGTNTTYYVKNWKDTWIGDMNDSGTITVEDIIVYQVANDGTETTLTVSSIDSANGKFVLSSSPDSSVQLFVTYVYSLIDPYTPSSKLSYATALLVAAYGYEKINRGMSPQQVYGNVRFMRDMRAGNEYFKRYQEEISKINSDMGDWEESETF